MTTNRTPSPLVTGFELYERLGQGSMGMVYRARDLENGRIGDWNAIYHRLNQIYNPSSLPETRGAQFHVGGSTAGATPST